MQHIDTEERDFRDEEKVSYVLESDLELTNHEALEQIWAILSNIVQNQLYGSNDTFCKHFQWNNRLLGNFESSEQHDLRRIKEILKKHPNIFKNNSDRLWYKIFFKAIRRRYVWLVKTILEMGIDIEETNDYHQNWLDILFSNFCFKVIKSWAIANQIINVYIYNDWQWGYTTPVLTVWKIGDLQSIDYMIYLNK